MKIIKRAVGKLLIINTILLSTLFSNTIEEDFLSTLDEVSTIATKTKVNIDHQPSTITVLTSKQLTHSGHRTIHDALSTVPGFEGIINARGWKSLVIRGSYVANAYGFDKVKLLIDGVSVNNTLYGTIFYYMNFPIELVERIEILRGPASVMYGTGAYSGAINIITKANSELKKVQSVFAYTDSYGSNSVGGVYKENGFAIDLYYLHDNKRVDFDSHRRGNSDGFPEDTPTDETHRELGVGATYKLNNFSFLLRMKQDRMGEYYGADLFRYGVDKEYGTKNSYHNAEIKYENSTEYLSYDVKTGVKEYTFNYKHRGLPENKLEKDLKGGVDRYLASAGVDSDTTAYITSLTDPFIEEKITQESISKFYSKERTSYMDLNFNKRIERADLNFGVFHSHTKNLENYIGDNLKPESEQTTTLESFVFSGTDPDTLSLMYEDLKTFDNGLVGENRERTINALYFHTLITLNEKTDIQGGFRVDEYSDLLDTPFSFSAGIVHRYDNNLNLKFSHGRSFRAPSIFEKYSFTTLNSDEGYEMRDGNSTLKPESISTTEASLIYKFSSKNFLKTTLFHSKLNDVIALSIDESDISEEEKAYIPFDDTGTFWNYDERISKGVEIEGQFHIDEKNDLSFNYTKIDTFCKGWQPFYTVDTAKDVPMADITHELANLSHKFRYNSKLSFITNANYTGEKTQNAEEEKISSSTIVNEVVTYKFNPEFSIEFAIKNLFNSARYMPSDWGFHDTGLEREDRYYSLKAAMEF